jgi:MFS family permease
MDLSLGSLLTNTAFYASYLHLSSTFLGTLTAVSTSFFVILAVPLGRLSDRVERTRILLTACLLLAGVSFVLPFCTRKIHLMVAFPCVGVSMALFWPAYEAWLAEREGGGSLIRRVMTFNLFWCVGITFGPFISGYLYQDSNPVIPFYLAGVFALCNGLVIYLHAKSRRKKAPAHFEPESEPQLEEIPPPASQTAYRQMARISNFASWFSLGVLRQLAPKLMLETGIAARTYGDLMLILGIVQILGFAWLGTHRSTRWHYRLMPLLGVQILAVVGFLGIGLLPRPIFWTSAFGLIGVCAALTYFSSMYYGLHGQADKGNKSGWHEAILGCGVLLGPFLGGILADSALGLKSPYLLCAGAIGICICIEWGIWVRSRR